MRPLAIRVQVGVDLSFEDAQLIIAAVETIERFAARGITIPDVMRGQKDCDDRSRAGKLSAAERRADQRQFDLKLKRILESLDADSDEDLEGGRDDVAAQRMSAVGYKCSARTVRRHRKRLGW